MATKQKVVAPFKKGETVKVKRGDFKARGTVLRTVDAGEGRGGGKWFEVKLADGSERRYRESNLAR